MENIKWVSGDANVGGWLILEDENGNPHLYPDNDVMPHTIENCWCKPVEEVLAQFDCGHKLIMFSHNTLDERE